MSKKDKGEEKLLKVESNEKQSNEGSTLEVNNEEKTIKKVKGKSIKPQKVIPKVHLQKFLLNTSYSIAIKKMLLMKFGKQMHTEDMWKEIIDKEITRAY